MLFPTLNFLLFFVTVAAVMVALRGRFQAQKLVLVAASYFFYAQWNWHFCLLLALSSVVTYAAGLLLNQARTHRRKIVSAAVTIHLMLLGTFKYFDFFVGSANALAQQLGLTAELPFFEIILPVGISFFTFHGISYVVDVYRGDVAVCWRLTDMLLYLSFFPQLVAGPIVRASFFLPQLYNPSRAALALGPPLLLILGGLFKKVVVANYLATDLVDPVFFDPAGFGTIDLVLAAYAYAIQIYCDFSAYSDMAIGLAALLGYRFPPNFNQPYRAQSLQEFWRRWHISLSSWLRDYLYKPLGGSRGGRGRTAANLMVTMLLGGIWHGAGLVAGRFLPPLPARPAWRIIATLVVFHFVCLTWIFFRADSFDTVTTYIATAASSAPGVTQASSFTVGLIMLGMAMQFAPPDWAERLGRKVTSWPDWALGAGAGAAMVAIDAMGPDGIAPFIYFQF